MPTPTPVSVALAASTDLRGVLERAEADPPALVYRCEGGCGAPVPRLRAWCDACGASATKMAAQRALNAARRSVSPDGARDWCRPGDQAFEAAMAGAPTEPGLRALYAKLPTPARTAETDAIVRGIWSRSWGSLLLLGPTGIGKSALLTALALAAIDRAAEGKLDEQGFAAAAGIRCVSALELAKAHARHRLGEGEPPIVRLAKRASILILDELGFEDQRFDPEIITEVLRARYEPAVKPTLVGSGQTLEKLNLRYGVATMRTIWQRGRTIDLHPQHPCAGTGCKERVSRLGEACARCGGGPAS